MDEPEKTIAEDVVVTKYKLSGEIVNRVLKKLIEKCVVGASVYDICVEGDKLIEEETNKVFKDCKRGIAFPTSCSINNCICHFSPLKSDKEVLLVEGDLVKLDLGAHVDGFIAVVAHSLVAGQKNEKGTTTGRLADVMLAANNAVEVALRSIKPGTENYTVSELITKVADQYKCKPISGMLSHQLKQFRIDGGLDSKSIIQNPTELQRKDLAKAEFGGNEVYAVDVIISTGEGKGREIDNKTTIYKKTDLIYQLKMKASRALYSDVTNKFGLMPFNLRAFDDDKKARLGLHECVEHKLLDPFNVLHEKENELVAQFKFTVLLTENGTSHKITGIPLELSRFKSEHSIADSSIKEVLNRAINPKKKKVSTSANGEDNKVPVSGSGDKK